MNNWNPTTQQEKELKDALVKLHASTDGVILTPMDQKREEAKQKRFILQGKSYFGAFCSFLLCTLISCPLILILCHISSSQGVCDDGQGLPDHRGQV